MQKKNLGQYFTPDIIVKFMVDLSGKPTESIILEPSSGKGAFLKELLSRGYKHIIAYEIDESIIGDKYDFVRNESFIGSTINESFDLVIGNPPYVRWKNLSNIQKAELKKNPIWKAYFNSLSDYLYIFIVKSIELLNEGGELIFITPDYWLSTTYSQTLRDYMVKNGFFESIINFVETPIFNGVATSTIIFKYIKTVASKPDKPINIIKFNSQRKLTPKDLISITNDEYDKRKIHFQKSQFSKNKKWLLIPDEIENELSIYEKKCSNDSVELFEEQRNYYHLGDIADIGNGMVSGLDKAFKIPNGTELTEKEEQVILEVVKAKHMRKYYYEETEKYFFLNETVNSELELIENYPNFYNLLKPFQPRLLTRYNYQKDLPYWHWAFPRNLALFRKSVPRILIPCKERISHKNFFRFTFAAPGIFPTQDVTGIILKPFIKESTHFVLAILNSSVVYDWIKAKGIMKGNIVEFSERPLSGIPIPMVNWSNSREVISHNEISNLCQSYIQNRNVETLENLGFEVNRFIESK